MLLGYARVSTADQNPNPSDRPATARRSNRRHPCRSRLRRRGFAAPPRSCVEVVARRRPLVIMRLDRLGCSVHLMTRGSQLRECRVGYECSSKASTLPPGCIKIPTLLATMSLETHCRSCQPGDPAVDIACTGGTGDLLSPCDGSPPAGGERTRNCSPQLRLNGRYLHFGSRSGVLASETIRTDNTRPTYKLDFSTPILMQTRSNANRRFCVTDTTVHTTCQDAPNSAVDYVEDSFSRAQGNMHSLGFTASLWFLSWMFASWTVSFARRSWRGVGRRRGRVGGAVRRYRPSWWVRSRPRRWAAFEGSPAAWRARLVRGGGSPFRAGLAVHHRRRGGIPTARTPPPRSARLSIGRCQPLVNALAANHHGPIMCMGKGGVGKTTVAAAIAVALARRGHHVLLTTTDPAAHLADTLDGSIDGLEVSRIDPAEATAVSATGC
ncbi:UNVERIFIED_CONTAM: anion-transporting ATPase [Williamsia faeni]